MLKAHVALKVAEMKVARHDEALARARAAKRNPQNDPVLQFLAEKSPERAQGLLGNGGPVLNASDPAVGLESKMRGLGIGHSTKKPPAYEDNMLKDRTWDDDEDDESDETVY